MVISLKQREIGLIGILDRTVPTHIQGAGSQNPEVVLANEIYHWKAHDFSFIIGFYPGGPFSLGCTHL